MKTNWIYLGTFKMEIDDEPEPTEEHEIGWRFPEDYTDEERTNERTTETDSDR